MPKAATPTKTALLDRLIVVVPGGSLPRINTLIFRPEGLVRTFPRGAIDPRAGAMPVLTDRLVIRKLLQDGGSDDRFAMTVRLAREMFGWKLDEFYDPER